MKAQTLRKVDRFLNPDPLTDETWDFFVPTEHARDNREIQKMIRRIEALGPGQRYRAVLSGHMGCGKSTELVRMRREIAPSVQVEVIDVVARTSLQTVDYRKLLMIAAHELLSVAETCKADLRSEDAAALLEWFDERTKEIVTSESRGVTVEAGAEVSFLRRLFAKFSARLEQSGETKDLAVRHAEERLDQLMLLLANVVRAIEAAIAPRRLMLVFENLDKMDSITQARDLFYGHRVQLLSIPCSVIYTMPIGLWYEPVGESSFEHRHYLPLIPVKPSPHGDDGSTSAGGRGVATLCEIVLRRMEASLIGRDTLERLVLHSGGVVRDLLYMVRYAASEADLDGAERIEAIHASRAINNLRSDYGRRLGPEAGSGVTYDEFRAAIGQPADWPKMEVAKSAAMKQALDGLVVLEYNGKTWYDLHPAVSGYLADRSGPS